MMEPNWVSLTVISDTCEVEMDVNTGRYRHRPRLSPLLVGVAIAEWRPGRPPDGPQARPSKG